MRQSRSTNKADFARFNKKRMSAYAHKYTLKKRFNITPENYQEMLIKQDYKCATCETKSGDGSRNNRRLSVDHCHKTGKIRGLLCVNCNTVLGKVDDDVERLKSLIKYLYENIPRD